MAAMATRIWASGILLLCLPIAPASGVLPTKDELARSHAWARAKFATPAASRPAGVGLTVRSNYGDVQRNGRDGKPLRIGETQFSDGLYCHANSRIRVTLPGPAKSFLAQLARRR